MPGNSSLGACAVQNWLKQPRTTAATSGGLQVAMHSQLPRFLVYVLFARFSILSVFDYPRFLSDWWSNRLYSNMMRLCNKSSQLTVNIKWLASMVWKCILHSSTKCFIVLWTTAPLTNSLIDWLMTIIFSFRYITAYRKELHIHINFVWDSCFCRYHGCQHPQRTARRWTKNRRSAAEESQRLPGSLITSLIIIIIMMMMMEFLVCLITLRT